jgi:DNA repair protein RadC
VHVPSTAACPRCGYVNANDDLPPDAFFRPWDLAHGRAAVKAYVESLGQEAQEWLLALYVDEHLQLLAVDTVARGDVASCPVPFWTLINRGRALKAAGFILVHNHPSGDPTPSWDDIQVTRRLAHVSHELDVPLLDHLIIAGDELREVGEWGWGGT